MARGLKFWIQEVEGQIVLSVHGKTRCCQISCVVTTQLMCTFVFACAKSRFSQDAKNKDADQSVHLHSLRVFVFLCLDSFYMPKPCLSSCRRGVQCRMVLVVIFFSRIFEIIIFCFVVAICDLEHDVEAIHGLC